MRVDREGKMELFLFLVHWLPAERLARKEETPSAPEQVPGAAYPVFDELPIPAELKLDRKISLIDAELRSKFRFLFCEGRCSPLSWRVFFKTIGVCPNPLQVLQ
jgi:hypothetical protein